MPVWRECKLGDLLEIKHGYAFLGKHFANSGSHIVLTPGSFYDEGGFKHKAEKEKWYNGPIPAEYVLDAGDIIVAMTEQAEGLLGSSAIIPRSGVYLHNQRLGLVRLRDETKTDKRFIYYLFNTKSVRQQIRASASGVKIRHTAPTRISEVRVKVPPFAAQRRVTSILSSYDVLIENNTRRIAILGEMAQTVYREWFVNFHFPGHKKIKIEFHNGRKVPNGWRVKDLFDVAEVTYGFPFKSKLFTEGGAGIPLVRIRDILANTTNTFTTESVDEKYLLCDGDLLVGMDGDFHMGKWSGGKAFLNQRVVRFRPKGSLPPYYLFLGLCEPIEHFDSTIVGTTVAHLSDRDLRSIRLLIPDSATLEQAASILNPCFEMEINLSLQNFNLRRTRDFLLPKLASGEINIEHLETEAVSQIS